MLKNKKDAGADQLTPSIPQYFSWINNTNEGATEKQTLINLDFFDYMKRTYGMQLKIYAWDAGNFDGASKHYGAEETEKLKKQFPNGYKPVVERAAKSGIRLGLWGSPDGYGNDEKTEKARYDFFVHLCRDYHFAEFKLDGVCGGLRPEKAALFAKMLRECREYSPDLVVLNHRLNLYEAEKHITTFLFNGDETYVDILNRNSKTAMHHRAFMFDRGHVEGLNRLSEDHGVCISSEIDYFEDELIYQAFGRCLILAPEIYGNPWLMRDDELPKLARIYNLHRRNAAILVNGKLLPESYGCHAITRGGDNKRFVNTGNNTWEKKTVTFKISELGLCGIDKVAVNIHHPYEKHLGIFNITDEVKIELMPFRAYLIEFAAPECAEPMLTECEYEIINEDENGKPVKVKFFGGKTPECEYITAKKENAPRLLGELGKIDGALSENDEQFIFETAMFAVNNDSLERRSAVRAGETAIPEVKAAREAFFGQERYALRGCDNANMFDGNPETFYDCTSKEYRGEKLRINGGCLRVDFGGEYDIDAVEIECFAAKKPTVEVPAFELPAFAEISPDLRDWRGNTDMPTVEVIDDSYIQKVIHYNVHDIYTVEGRRLKITYKFNGNARYLRINHPMDRIFSVKLVKNGEYITPNAPRANILQSGFRYNRTRAVQTGEFTLPVIDRPSKIAIAVEGRHGIEGVCFAAEIDGKSYGFPERAPAFSANMWEHYVHLTEENNTFFLPVDESVSGKRIKITALFTHESGKDIPCRVYLCDKH